jgi:hypothetical protein
MVRPGVRPAARKVKDLDGLGKEVLTKLILSCGFRDLPLYGLNRNYPNGSHFYSKPVSNLILIGKPNSLPAQCRPWWGTFRPCSSICYCRPKGKLGPKRHDRGHRPRMPDVSLPPLPDSGANGRGPFFRFMKIPQPRYRKTK